MITSIYREKASDKIQNPERVQDGENTLDAEYISLHRCNKNTSTDVSILTEPWLNISRSPDHWKNYTDPCTIWVDKERKREGGGRWDLDHTCGCRSWSRERFPHPGQSFGTQGKHIRLSVSEAADMTVWIEWKPHRQSCHETMCAHGAVTSAHSG